MHRPPHGLLPPAVQRRTRRSPWSAARCGQPASCGADRPGWTNSPRPARPRTPRRARGLGHHRAHHRHAQNVGLELHQQRVVDHAAVNFERGKLHAIARQLQALGLNMTLDTLRFHRELCMGRLIISADVLNKAGNWLEQILSANAQAHVFDTDALTNVLGDVWFRTCLHAAHLGLWVTKRYADSNLTKKNQAGIRNRLLITLAAIKAMIV